MGFFLSPNFFLVAKVSADRSEDNSSNSSNGSSPSSQPNSSQTSPEHKIVATEQSAAGEDNSELSVEVEHNSKVTMYIGDDNSDQLTDSAILLPEVNHNSSEQTVIISSDTSVRVDGAEVNMNINNINGSVSQKTIVANGASTNENGVGHTHQLNGSDKRLVVTTV